MRSLNQALAVMVLSLTVLSPAVSLARGDAQGRQILFDEDAAGCRDRRSCLVDQKPTTEKTTTANNERSAETSDLSLPVKMSRSGICHAPGTRYYAKTQRFTPYKTLRDCLRDGGRNPLR